MMNLLKALCLHRFSLVDVFIVGWIVSSDLSFVAVCVAILLWSVLTSTLQLLIDTYDERKKDDTANH